MEHTQSDARDFDTEPAKVLFSETMKGSAKLKRAFQSSVAGYKRGNE